MIVRTRLDAGVRHLDQLVANAEDRFSLRTGQRINGKPSLLHSIDETAFEQARKMIRHVGLTQVRVFGDVAHGSGPVTKGFKNGETRQVGEASKELRLGLEYGRGYHGSLCHISSQ